MSKPTNKQRIAKLIREQERDVEEYVKHCPTKASLWNAILKPGLPPKKGSPRKPISEAIMEMVVREYPKLVKRYTRK